MHRPPLVMVVEDDVEMNELQQELLAIHGLGSLPAYDGQQAVEICQSCDAVLLDLMMPKIDGFEACRRIREACCPHTPIIIVTALDNEECRKQGFEVGADAYFSKPFDPDEVIGTLQRLLEEAGNKD